MNPLLASLLEITVASVVIYGVLTLFRRLLKKHLSAAFQMALWSILLLRLMLPVTLESGVHLPLAPAPAANEGTHFNAGANASGAGGPAEAQLNPNPPLAAGGNAGSAEAASPGPTAPAATADIAAILLTVWLAGVAANAALLLATSLRLAAQRNRNAGSVPLEVTRAVLACKVKLKVRANVRIRMLGSIKAPALAVSIRPTLLLPTDMTERYSAQELRYSVLHELMHWRRRDPWLCLLVNLLRCVHWFNPVVWLMVPQIRMDMETACDAAVVRQMNAGEKKQYASVIISMFSGGGKAQMALGMAMENNRATVERRIRGVFMRGRTNRGARALAAATAMLLLFTCFTTGCLPASTPAASSDPQTTATISAADPSATPEVTPEPTAVISQNQAGEGMIFPDSDTRLLMWDELVTLPPDKLALARSEIYARAGYPFTDDSNIAYYGKLSWYKPDQGFNESDFTDVQRANIVLIRAAENAAGGKLTELKSGTALDYDQDGELETLTFSAPNNYHMNLTLKDGAETTVWDVSCDTPSGKVYLGDIDFRDKMLDLFVDSSGPSDDYEVYVAGVGDKGFLQRDSLPGAINRIVPDGKGTVIANRRMGILMTWFHDVNYRLDSSGKLAFVEQPSYPMGNFTVKTKVAIPLKKSASPDAETAFTVPAGAEVQLVSTDDKRWVEIKASAGTGWLEMADLYTLKDPDLAAADAFEGLMLAD